MLPYGSGSYTTLEAIETEFGGAGVAFPYKLLFVLDGGRPPAGQGGKNGRSVSVWSCCVFFYAHMLMKNE